MAYACCKCRLTKMNDMIKEFIENRYQSSHPNSVLLRNELVRACTEFADSEFSDTKFGSELLSGSQQKFWSCVSEALVYDRLRKLDLRVPEKRGEGPDFLLMDGEQKIWIEVVCPQSSGDVSSAFLHMEPGSVVSFPHHELLLRWTAAIREKARRSIKDGDAYVIAVNGCCLRNGPFSSLKGISQFPFAVEATLGVGPFQLSIDRNTLEAIETGHQDRPFVKSRNGSEVNARVFLDEMYNHVSAIWALDLNGSAIYGGHEPMCVVHNPKAVVPVAAGLLPSEHDYVARIDGEYLVLDLPS